MSEKFDIGAIYWITDFMLGNYKNQEGCHLCGHWWFLRINSYLQPLNRKIQGQKINALMWQSHADEILV